jgi:ribosomal protein L10
MQKYQKIIFDNNKILVIAHMNNVDSEDWKFLQEGLELLNWNFIRPKNNLIKSLFLEPEASNIKQFLSLFVGPTIIFYGEKSDSFRFSEVLEHLKKLALDDTIIPLCVKYNENILSLKFVKESLNGLKKNKSDYQKDILILSKSTILTQVTVLNNLKLSYIKKLKLLEKINADNKSTS